VDIPTSVAMDQSESPLHHCTICPLFNQHRAPISCVYLSIYPHNLMNWHTVLQWSRPQMRVPMYVNMGIYPPMNDANCMTLPEMPDIDRYCHMYVHGTYCMHVLTKRCYSLLQPWICSHSLALNVFLFPPTHTCVSDDLIWFIQAFSSSERMRSGKKIEFYS
jgi:hypothetical protein